MSGFAVFIITCSEFKRIIIPELNVTEIWMKLCQASGYTNKELAGYNLENEETIEDVVY